MFDDFTYQPPLISTISYPQSTNPLQLGLVNRAIFSLEFTDMDFSKILFNNTSFFFFNFFGWVSQFRCAINGITFCVSRWEEAQRNRKDESFCFFTSHHTHSNKAWWLDQYELFPKTTINILIDGHHSFGCASWIFVRHPSFQLLYYFLFTRVWR